MSWFRALLLAATFAPAPAFADEPEWLVTEVDVGREPAAFANAVSVGDSLRRHGQVVIAGSAAAKQFARDQSRSPVQLQSSEIEQFDRLLRALADHLASENLDDARAVMGELSENSQDALDYLNRQAERARRRYHGCLLMGQLLSKAGQEPESTDQLRSCARDFPGFEPERSPYLPESIRAYFEHVLQELRAIPASTLRVEITHTRDDQQDDERCHALVNGIDKGAVPATVANIRAEAVRVQVECGDGPARIHDVALTPGKNTLAIDPIFDGAVGTQGSLTLSYENPVRASQLVLDHSLAVAAAVGVAQMVLVMNGDLLRVDVTTHRITARASLSEGTLDAVVSRLVEGAATLGEVPAQAAAAQAAQVAPAAAIVAAQPPQPDLEAIEKRAAPVRDEDSSSHVPYGTLGWISAGGAVAAGATALIAWRVREGHVDDFNTANDAACTMLGSETTPMCASVLRNIETAETVTIVAGVVGGSLAVVSAVFFVLDSGSHPADARAQQSCGAGPGDVGVACALRF